MHDLGVELHAIEAPPLVGDGGVGRVPAGGDGREAVGQRGHAVAVAHPHRRGLALRCHAFKQGRRRLHLDQRGAVFTLARRLHNAAKPGHHALLAVADAEHGHARRENRIRNLRRALVQNARRAAGQDDRLRLQLRDGFPGRVKRYDLGIDIRLAHAPCDQLRELSAEIHDENGVGYG